jgi:hypothetical protein
MSDGPPIGGRRACGRSWRPLTREAGSLLEFADGPAAKKSGPLSLFFERFKAEGTGVEPATGFPAPHFQCGR